MANNIVQLHEDTEFVATCPDCNNKYWKLILDKGGDKWTRILGSVCADCGHFNEWEVVRTETQ